MFLQITTSDVLLYFRPLYWLHWPSNYYFQTSSDYDVLLFSDFIVLFRPLWPSDYDF